MVAADVHLASVAELYQLQMDGGRYFVHENPESAKSWERVPMRALAQDKRVYKITGDQWQYNQESFQGNPVRKESNKLEE